MSNAGLFVRLDTTEKIPGAYLPAWTAVTTTVANNRLDHEAVITAVGVTAADTIDLRLATSNDEAENTPDMLDLASMSAVAGTAEFTLSMTFAQPSSGPINLLYRK